MTSQLTVPQLCKTIKACIDKGDHAANKAEQFYIAAGQHLKTLKAEHNGNWAEWETLLREKVGIGKSRASELMLIADGTKTVEGVKADTAERQQRHRKLSPLRHGEDTPREVFCDDCGEQRICKCCGGKLFTLTKVWVVKRGEQIVADGFATEAEAKSWSDRHPPPSEDVGA
jgi:hypothetical protein